MSPWVLKMQDCFLDCETSLTHPWNQQSGKQTSDHVKSPQLRGGTLTALQKCYSLPSSLGLPQNIPSGPILFTWKTGSLHVGNSSCLRNHLYGKRVHFSKIGRLEELYRKTNVSK